MPTAGIGDPPRPDSHFVDPDFKSLTAASTADFDRPYKRMPSVEIVIAWPEALAIAVGVRWRSDSPTCVGRGEDDRIPRIDCQDWLEVTGEVTVERAPLQRNLVDCHCD